MAGVHENIDELIAAVAKETGVAAEDVRKVLGASFESTKAYIERQLGPLSDTDLNQVAGGGFSIDPHLGPGGLPKLPGVPRKFGGYTVDV